MEQKENILIYKEKPYYTDDELRLYYTIAIDEWEKNNNPAMANHYRILLKMMEDEKKSNRSKG